MSVSNSTVPAVDSYDDLKRDFVKVEGAAEAGEHNNADGAAIFSPGAELDVVEERGWAKELVAIDITRLKARVRETDNVGTTPGHVDAVLEISTDEQLQNLPGGDQDPPIITPPSTHGDFASLDPAPSWNVDQWEGTEVIAHYFKSGLSPFNDTVNGTGGGGSYQDFIHRMHFRNDFGRGPIFDRQDSLFIHGSLQGIQSPNQWWNLGATMIFYWNEFEIPDRLIL